jgi:hypothetical protein
MLLLGGSQWSRLLHKVREEASYSCAFIVFISAAKDVSWFQNFVEHVVLRFKYSSVCHETARMGNSINSTPRRSDVGIFRPELEGDWSIHSAYCSP